MQAVDWLRLHDLHGLLQRIDRLVLNGLLHSLLLDLRLQRLDRVLHLRLHRLLLHRLYGLTLHGLLLYGLHRLLLNGLHCLLHRLLVHGGLQHQAAIQAE